MRQPQVNSDAPVGQLGEYYMPFLEKADYAGRHDGDGIPLLDYHGKIGLQYNPIAIAQWGLGNFNLFLRSRDEGHERNSWPPPTGLVNHLEPNSLGVPVWNHLFDWEYRTPLKAPWYSGLAQGQGISLLVRVAQETEGSEYLEAADRPSPVSRSRLRKAECFSLTNAATSGSRSTLFHRRPIS